MVNNRTEYKEHCLRALGAPLVVIDVADEQVEDRVDEAITFFNEYYYDGIEKLYHKHILTQTNIDSGTIQLPDHIWSVSKIWNTGQSSSPNSATYIFDQQYQMRLNDLRDITSTDISYYEMSMGYLALLEYTFQVARQFRFNRLNNTLRLDVAKERLTAGQTLLVESYSAIDPAANPKMWNDRSFLKYGAALIKRQWAQNLSKYSNMTLPGGLTIDGQSMYSTADQEVSELEQEIINNSAPLEFFMA